MSWNNLDFISSFFFVVCIGLFCSCLSNDDDAQWSKFNGVYVTVGGDNIRGYKLYTDFGAILVPTEESLNRIPWLKEVQRAIVSLLIGWKWKYNSIGGRKNLWCYIKQYEWNEPTDSYFYSSCWHFKWRVSNIRSRLYPTKK